MANYKENWLRHLEEAIPDKALGNKLSMYAIALEGWRRGLILKFYHTYNKSEKRIKVVYSLSRKGKKHHFAVSRGDKVTKEAIDICVNKDTTKQYLLNAGVSVPQGKGFDSNVFHEDILDYADKIGYPVVLKPTDGKSGKGVIVNIKDREELKRSLILVREKHDKKTVVLENHINGEDIRVYVIGDKVIGAITRIPANIIGDGKNSIKKLIAIKNKQRNNNPNHYKRPIKVDDELVKYVESEGFTLEDVPPSGERIYLKKTSNVSAGGEPIDVTDELTEELKNTAINAAKAVPGLEHCAIDMMVNKKNNIGAVIEINSKPQIGGHLFPMEGKPRDIPKAIIDYYFPETDQTNTPFYYDFDSFLYPLNSGAAKEVTAKRIPQYKPVVTSFEVFGKVQGVGYRQWVRKKAHSLRLHGFVKNNTVKKSVFIVIAGEGQSVEEFRKIVKSKGPKKAKVMEVVESGWDSPVKMGFEILERNENVKIQRLEMKLNEAKKRNKKLKQKLEETNSKYKELKNSRSYRYTAPIRRIKTIFKDNSNRS